MPDFPFDTVGLTSEQIDNFQETYTALKSKFNIQQTGDIDFHLEDFEVFKRFFAVNLRDSFLIKHSGCSSYVLFTENHIKLPHDKGGISEFCECQIWALAYLKRNLGRVLIRPETLADKIIELIHPIEIDFKEDKAFSDTFYVVANDHEKAVNGIDRNLRNAIMDVREDDFIIEIADHTLIIGSKKPITAARAVHLAEFVARVASMC
ncbi:MAG: hypothetical protein ABI367_03430 [Mucilaginibacter sp.]